jgi:trk system potassium uptake protein TrkH
LITKALAVISVSFSITVLLLILLILTNSLDIRDAAYEVFSATATVGLSRNITSSLNGAGRVIIIIAMYLGRVGPVSMAIAFKSRSTNNKISHTDGHFIVG